MTRHAYGPHRKEDQPQTVTVFDAAGDYQAPVPFEVRRGRYQLNQRAYEQARAAVVEDVVTCH